MSYAIMRVNKLKRSSAVGGADRHNERARETPNADPSKRAENRTLINNAITFDQAVLSAALIQKASISIDDPPVPTSEANVDDRAGQHRAASLCRVRLSLHAMMCDEASLVREAEAAIERETAIRKHDEDRKRVVRRRNKSKNSSEQLPLQQQQKLSESEKQERRVKREAERRERWEQQREERAARHEAERRTIDDGYPLAEHARIVGQSFAESTPLTAQVNRMIRRAGGKPRIDSVECVEFVYAASPEFFEQDVDADGAPAPERVERFVARNMRFMEDCTEEGLVFVKATLHMDETTPHIHAVAVPLDPEGKLNCKHHLGGDRKRMSAWQTKYHSYVAPLGLERGIEGSQATHQELKQFGGILKNKVKVEIDRSRLPPEPQYMSSQSVIRLQLLSMETAIKKQLEERFELLRKQALAARDERRKRLDAERRAEAAERRADEHDEGLRRAVAETATIAARTKRLNDESWRQVCKSTALAERLATRRLLAEVAHRRAEQLLAEHVERAAQTRHEIIRDGEVCHVSLDDLRHEALLAAKQRVVTGETLDGDTRAQYVKETKRLAPIADAVRRAHDAEALRLRARAQEAAARLEQARFDAGLAHAVGQQDTPPTASLIASAEITQSQDEALRRGDVESFRSLELLREQCGAKRQVTIRTPAEIGSLKARVVLSELNARATQQRFAAWRATLPDLQVEVAEASRSEFGLPMSTQPEHDRRFSLAEVSRLRDESIRRRHVNRKDQRSLSAAERRDASSPQPQSATEQQQQTRLDAACLAVDRQLDALVAEREAEVMLANMKRQAMRSAAREEQERDPMSFHNAAARYTPAEMESLEELAWEIRDAEAMREVLALEEALVARGNVAPEAACRRAVAREHYALGRCVAAIVNAERLDTRSDDKLRSAEADDIPRQQHVIAYKQSEAWRASSLSFAALTHDDDVAQVEQQLDKEHRERMQFATQAHEVRSLVVSHVGRLLIEHAMAQEIKPLYTRREVEELERFCRLLIADAKLGGAQRKIGEDVAASSRAQEYAPTRYEFESITASDANNINAAVGRNAHAVPAVHDGRSATEVDTKPAAATCADFPTTCTESETISTTTNAFTISVLPAGVPTSPNATMSPETKTIAGLLAERAEETERYRGYDRANLNQDEIVAEHYAQLDAERRSLQQRAGTSPAGSSVSRDAAELPTLDEYIAKYEQATSAGLSHLIDEDSDAYVPRRNMMRQENEISYDDFAP